MHSVACDDEMVRAWLELETIAIGDVPDERDAVWFVSCKRLAADIEAVDAVEGQRDMLEEATLGLHVAAEQRRADELPGSEARLGQTSLHRHDPDPYRLRTRPRWT